MTRTKTIVITAFALVVLFHHSSPAVAQLAVPGPITTPTITKQFDFAVPFTLTVPHPCKPSFVLMDGTLNLRLTTALAEDFQFSISANLTGSGQEADASGVPVVSGKLPYEYLAETRASAEFPDGTPTFFGHNLEVIADLIRSDSDRFTMTAEFDLEYTNGVPTTPTLRMIEVSCQ